MAMADNSGHTATLRSAQIPHSGTSYVRGTSGEIATLEQLYEEERW